jgi:metal-responsive CopG/Arc/MetJ family transcriptional regulator
MARRQVGESREANGEKKTVVVKLDRDLVIWLDVFAARRDKYRSEAIQMVLQWAREQLEPLDEKGRAPL